MLGQETKQKTPTIEVITTMKCPHCGKEIPDPTINPSIIDSTVLRNSLLRPQEPNCFNCSNHQTCKRIHEKNHYERDAGHCKDYQKGFDYRWLQYADT